MVKKIMRKDKPTYEELEARNRELEKNMEDFELFRQMIENSLDPVFMIDDDEGCRMVYVNEAARKHYGTSFDEIYTWTIPDWDPNFTYEKLPQHVEDIKKLKHLDIESLHKVNGNEIVPVTISINLIKYKGHICHYGYIKNISERKKFEQALIDSNDKISLLMNSTAEGICGIDLNGCCTYANKSCIELLGYKSEKELLGVNMHNLVHHSYPNKQPMKVENCKINLAFRQGVGTHVDDEVFWRPDGTSFPVEYFSFPQFKNGQIIGTVVAFNDISERKLAEEALKERIKELTGIYSLGLLTEKYENQEDVYHEFVNFVVPKSMRFPEKVFVSLEIDNNIYRNNENFIPIVNSKFLSAPIIIFGKPLGKLFVTYIEDLPFIDIHEQNLINAYAERISKNAERYKTQQDLIIANKKTEESETLIRSIFENLDDCIFVIDVFPNNKFKIKIVNPAEANALNMKKSDIEGKFIDELFPEDKVNSILAKYRHVRDTRKIYKYEEEFEFVTKVFYSTILVPLVDELGETYRIIGVSRDITDRKKAEQILKENAKQLLNLNADKDRFISILAHDLKNPFSAILGFLELLNENIHEYDIDTIEEQLQIVNNSAKNVFNLLDAILMWASSQSGKIKYEPQNLSFADISKEVVESLKLNANSKNITITHFVADDISVFADSFMLKTVLRNLISNAIKFTNTNGRIDIFAEQTDSFLQISVSDNGIGIAPENVSKLFDISQKHTTTGTANESGTGLGLLLCKDFVEKHGGKIWVESEFEKGSNFKFTIPLLV